MLRKKIDTFNHSNCRLINNIDKYFGYYLDSLLSDMSGNRYPYIQNPSIDSKLEELITSDGTTIHYLLGHKGIGKSTSIHYNLNEERIKSKLVNEKIIYIKKSFDRSFAANSSGSIILHEIESKVRDALISAYSDELERKEKLYDFLNETESLRHILLEFDYFNLFQNHEFEEEKFDKFLDRLKNDQPAKYCAFLLKFCVSELEFRKIFFILDDLEGIDFKSTRFVLDTVHKLKHCLHEISNGKTFIRLLISCRPHTYDQIRNDKLLNGWGLQDIKYAEPVSLDEIFKSRLDYHIERVGRGKLRQGEVTVNDVEKWEKGLVALREAVHNLCDRRKVQISNLNNYDIRTSLITLIQILKSPYWHNKNVEGAFDPEFYGKIRETQAMFVRALLLDTTSNKYRSNGIPNIFKNHQDASSDLLHWFIFSYLINTNDGDIKLTDIKSSLSQYFSDRRVAEAIEREIGEGYFIYKEVAGDIDYIIKLPAIDELRKLLSDSSVYTELMLFDTFLDEGIYKKIKEKTLSVSKENYPETMLSIVLDFASYMFHKESFLLFIRYITEINDGTNDLPNYSIGESLLSDYIYKGIKSSIDRYYTSTCDTGAIDNAIKEMQKINTNINSFKELIENNFVVSGDGNDLEIKNNLYNHLKDQCGSTFNIEGLLQEVEVEYIPLLKSIIQINNDSNSKIKIIPRKNGKISIKRNHNFLLSSIPKYDLEGILALFVAANQLIKSNPEALGEYKDSFEKGENGITKSDNKEELNLGISEIKNVLATIATDSMKGAAVDAGKSMVRDIFSNMLEKIVNAIGTS